MNGWPIVAAILAVVGTDEAGIRMALRATARTSVVCFTPAFAASSLWRRWPNAATAWLVRNRRQLGVSFASSHAIHLVMILWLAGWTWAGLLARTPTVTLVFGGIAYVVIALMTATSFDASAAWLGPRRWRRLHTVGSFYVWFIFALNFFVLAFRSPIYWPFAALLAGSMAARLAARRDRAVATATPLRTAHLAR